MASDNAAIISFRFTKANLIFSSLGKFSVITQHVFLIASANSLCSGGYTSGTKEMITWLRQRSRPYLFSNTLAPIIAATSIKAFQIVKKRNDLRNKLHFNSNYFRKKIIDLGFKISGNGHPIIPIIIKDAILAKKIAQELNLKCILVVSFSYPVVPKNESIIRVQISSKHSKKNLDFAINNFEKIGKKLKII